MREAHSGCISTIFYPVIDLPIVHAQQPGKAIEDKTAHPVWDRFIVMAMVEVEHENSEHDGCSVHQHHIGGEDAWKIFYCIAIIISMCMQVIV